MPTRSLSAPRRVALAVGSEVPLEDFGFSVHSAFGSAMNLRVTGRRFLVTVMGPEADDHPQGIRLSASERFDSWPVPAGTPGRRDGNALVFGAPHLLSIDLSVAVTSKREDPPYIDPRDDSWWETWRECASFLEELQERKAAELRLDSLLGASSPRTILGARLAGAARDVTGSIRAGRVDAAGLAASRLMGLGTGSTPSGDDFLCGFIAALWCASAKGSAERRFLIEWGSVLSARLDSSNAISATFLECTIAGCFSGALSALAATLQGGSAGETDPGARAAMEKLCAPGHSSGMDTATGFLFGLWFRADGEMRRHAP